MKRMVAAVVVIVASAARAEPVPDASLRAVVDRVVRLELADNAPSLEGRMLSFDWNEVTIAATGTNEVVTIARARVQRVILVELVAPERRRAWGLHFGVPGTLVGDVDLGRVHAFVSPNVLLPILTASGESAWFGGSIGGGISIKMSRRWKLDAFAAVMPLHYTSFYTYLAAGVGAGFRYTAPSGLSVGFTLPVLGFADRLGRSPFGYDAPFRYTDSLGYFYFAGLTTLPLVTVGYRFPG